MFSLDRALTETYEFQGKCYCIISFQYIDMDFLPCAHHFRSFRTMTDGSSSVRKGRLKAQVP